MNTAKCDDFDYYDEVKKCSMCRGDVHTHIDDVNITEDGDEIPLLRHHCHKCGEIFDYREYCKLDEYKQ